MAKKSKNASKKSSAIKTKRSYSADSNHPKTEATDETSQKTESLDDNRVTDGPQSEAAELLIHDDTPLDDKVTPDEASATPAVTSEDILIPSEPEQTSHEQPALAPEISRRGKRGFWIILCVMLVVAVLFGIGYYFRQAHSPDMAANAALVTEIGQRAVLPTGETPSISTVVNTDKANQSFLANAAVGDKVLLYFQAGRAVLYRPSTHQIVNMGPLTQPPAKVFLRNGTPAPIPSAVSDRLTTTNGFSVISEDASSKQNYGKTLVVDIRGNRPDLATRAAKLVGGQVAKLPAGETPPDADILVIVGASESVLK